MWKLVPKPLNKSVISSKRVFRNKYDEQGIITRNKAGLVVKWYSQEEGIDNEETFSPAGRLEAVESFLIMLHQKISKFIKLM
ncbi:putative RNA-directed DNA polymerase [Helianthus annuus]|nr:putative RNA-directed DNA polymerase [Helianthus annuus]